MHEISLASSLLDIINEQAAKHRFNRVNAVKLSLGCASSVEPKALEFAFSVQAQGTIADGASLRFEMQPVVHYCFSCRRDHSAEVFSSVCAFCGSEDVILTGGTEELRLLELDVD